MILKMPKCIDLLTPRKRFTISIRWSFSTKFSSYWCSFWASSPSTTLLTNRRQKETWRQQPRGLPSSPTWRPSSRHRNAQSDRIHWPIPKLSLEWRSSLQQWDAPKQLKLSTSVLSTLTSLVAINFIAMIFCCFYLSYCWSKLLLFLTCPLDLE